MHNAIVGRLLEHTRASLDERTTIILGVNPAPRNNTSDTAPTRADLQHALELARTALNGRPQELRGLINAARATLRRLGLTQEDSTVAYASLCTIRDSLDEIEEAAAGAGYPMAEPPQPVPRQFLVSRASVFSEIESLEDRLTTLQAELDRLDEARGSIDSSSYQDALIEFTVETAGAHVKISRLLASQRQIDAQGLAVSIEGAGSIIKSFWLTIDPRIRAVAAAISKVIVDIGRSLSKAASATVSAGRQVLKLAIQVVRQNQSEQRADTVPFSVLQSFSETCLNAKRPADITSPFAEILASLGITFWYIGSAGIEDRHDASLKEVGFSFGSTTPFAPFQVDPVFLHAIAGGKKMTWSAARDELVGDSVSSRFMPDVPDALILPIHGLGYRPAVVVFGGEKFKSDTEASLYLLGSLAYEGLRRLTESFRPVPPVLTEREKEVIRWVAEGKSAVTIGTILGISSATVRTYQEQLRKKYGVGTLVQAVVLAALDGNLRSSISE